MLLFEIAQQLQRFWPSLLVILIVIYLARNKFLNGINQYPGPSLAGYTNWWRYYDVLKRHHQHSQIALHRKLGDVVRLGPNVLSFASPRAIKDIYGLNKGYTKTEFYPVQQNVSEGIRIPSLFSTLDESYHAALRRRVNSAFAMSTLVLYEPLVDTTTAAFLDRTETLFCHPARPCDFARWLQFFAFDVIGSISFSKRLGFIDNFEDVDGIIEAIADTLKYAGTMGQQPWLDRYFLRKNPLKMFLMKRGIISSSNPIAAFASRRIAERRSELSALKASSNSADPAALEDNVKGVDMLSRLMLAQKADPAFMNDQRVLTVTTSLINAGSDTTAISLSSIFYHLLKHPHTYQKLLHELDTAVDNGTIVPSADGLLSWHDAQKLPYLDAVIQESFRLFPAAGLLLERHVPPGGASIDGRHIPGGTIVGCNAWVLHRREEVFGCDVDAFRPERWLEATPEKLKEMKATMFQFGAGARTCIGRNISILEIYKLVPSFLGRFEIELIDPAKEWRTENCWFVRQLDFDVGFRRRRARPSEKA